MSLWIRIRLWLSRCKHTPKRIRPYKNYHISYTGTLHRHVGGDLTPGLSSIGADGSRFFYVGNYARYSYAYFRVHPAMTLRAAVGIYYGKDPGDHNSISELIED